MYLLIVREKDKEGAPTEILDVKIVPAKDFDRYAQRAADKKVRAPFRLTRVGEAAGTHLSTRPLILYDKAKKLSIAKNKIAVICQSFFSNFSKFSKKFFVTTVRGREKAPSVGSLTLKMTLMCPCPLARA